MSRVNLTAANLAHLDQRRAQCDDALNTLTAETAALIDEFGPELALPLLAANLAALNPGLTATALATALIRLANPHRNT